MCSCTDVIIWFFAFLSWFISAVWVQDSVVNSLTHA
jgi:hypothetical protein